MNSNCKSAFSWMANAGAALLLVAVLGVVTWRLSAFVVDPAKGPSLDRPGLASFRDVIYYPTVAVADGVNPYDSVRDGNTQRYMHRYPVGSHFPLYSPLILLIHAPLVALPLGTSMIVFCGLNVLLLVAFAWTTIRCCGLKPGVASVLLLSAALLASQPGRANFNSGQAVLLLSLAACGALGNAQRPWLGALSLAVLTLKPTFGGPLGILILARRQWRTAVLGLGLGGLMAALGGAIIFARSGDLSVAGVRGILQGNHEHFSNDPEHDFDETNKLNTTDTIERLAGRPLPSALGIAIPAAILGLTGYALWSASGRTLAKADSQGQTESLESAGSTTSALAILAMYLCVYHLIYDGVLLAVPALAAAAGRHASWQAVPRHARWLLTALLLVPFVNVLWTGLFDAAMARLGVPWGRDEGEFAAQTFAIVSAANGVALSCAWLLLLPYVAWVRAGVWTEASPLGSPSIEVERYRGADAPRSP